jgi:hypothetical protein
MSGYSGPEITNDGLVLCVDAANPKSYPGSGNAWSDLSGNRNTGFLQNSPIYNSANGGSIVLDGTDDYISFAYNSSLNIGGQNITLSAWVRPTALVNSNGGGGIIVRESGSNNGLYEMLLIRSANINWTFFRMFNIGTYFPQQIPIELNTYYNIVCVYDNGTMRNYINGIQEGSGSSQNINITTNNSAVVWLGLRIADPASLFPGNIAQAQIYNRALSATEVQQNFNALRGRFNI